MPGQLRSVQALRALAALLVVIYHATVLWGDRAPAGTAAPWHQGNSGVDLFFVISGFVMLLSARGLPPGPGAWAVFLRARLIRVLPFYWLATLAKLAAVLAWPAAALHTHLTPWNVVASFLLLPSRNGAGQIAPVLVVGWTLSFEMLFYAVFAAALRLGAEPLAVMAPAMGLLALLAPADRGAWPAPASLLDPIVLEFVMGMAAGHALLRPGAPRARPWLALLAGAAGLFVLLCVPVHGPWMRPLVWGTGAAAVLWAAVSAEPWLGRRVPHLAVAAGEASYSLYLTHGFVLPLLGMAAAAAGLPASPAFRAAFVLACVAASLAFALLAFRWAEGPLVRWLRRRVPGPPARRLSAPETAI